MKNFLLLLCFVFGLYSHLNASENIIADNQSQYVIYVSTNAIPAEKNAATILQSYLKQSTGVSLPITDSKPDDFFICVGQDQALSSIDFNKLQPDEIILKTAKNSLYLSGSRPRGSLYAVYEFLEKYLGVRFITADETLVPKHNTLKLPELNYRYAPPFAIRGLLYTDIKTKKFTSQLRLNGHFNGLPVELGGRNSILGWCHTFDSFIPAKKYLKKHPEWFSLRNGSRCGGMFKGQLCLSDKSLKKKMTEEVLKRLRAHPNAKMISVSQNDNNSSCQCEKCRALDKKYGGPSGTLIWFVNQIAEEVAKEFPDVVVETLAYTYTRGIPKNITPAPNVLIRLCSIEADCSRPLTAPENAKFLNDMKSWQKIAPHLGIWYYTANYSNYFIPHPNWHVLAQDLRLFASAHIYRMFIEGSHGKNVYQADFADLRVWLSSRLLWNPNLDPEKLTREFLDLYYKEAAPDIASYMKLLEKEVTRKGARLICYLNDTSSWLRLKTLLKARSILNQAQQKVVDDSKISERVDRLVAEINYALLQRGEYSIFSKKTQALPPVDLNAAFKVIEKASKRWSKEACGKVLKKQALSNLKQSISSPSPNRIPPEFCKNTAPDDWFEFTASQFNRRPKTIVDDSDSTYGKSLKYDIPGRWSIQHSLPCNPSEKNFYWHVWLAVKIPDVSSKQLNETVLSAGLYGISNKRTIPYNFSGKVFSDGKYHWLNLGTVNLNSPYYVWIMNRPDITSFIDRIVITGVNTGQTSTIDDSGKIPDICKGLDASKWQTHPAASSLIKRFIGNGAEIIADKNSASGSVVKLSPKMTTWAVQLRKIPQGKYDVYLEMRCDTDKPSGKVLKAGRYPGRATMIKTSSCAGKNYKSILIAKNAVINKGNYIYCCRTKNPSVENVFLDRFILIKK